MKNSENETLPLSEGDCTGLFFALVNISHLLRQVCPPDTETEGSRTVIKTLLDGKEDCIARGYPFGAEVLAHVIGGWQSKHYWEKLIIKA